MIFRTKGELLEYLGKDKKYVRLIDRMIVKGEVVMKGGVYEYDDPVSELKVRVKELEEEVEGLKKEKGELIMQLISSGEESSEKSEKEVVEKVYQYMTKVLHLRVNHDEYIEWIENN